MNEDEARGERLRRAAAGRTQAWLAERAGVAASSVNGYLKGRVPQADVAVRICDALGIGLRWYLFGQSHPSEGSDALVQVPFADDPARALTFPRNLVDMFGSAHQDLCCAEARGALMEPTIPKGAEVLATRAVGKIEDGGVYLVEIGGQQLIRRIRLRADGGLLGVCDNPAAQTEVADVIPRDCVKARAVWVSHAV